MTEIDKMEAGPEIDRLVVEQVLQQPYRKPTHGSCCTCQTCGQYYDDCLCGISDDITFAWQVLDKLDEDWRIMLVQWWSGKEWQCTLEPMGTLETTRGGLLGAGSSIASADTPALAICRAALKTSQEK